MSDPDDDLPLDRTPSPTLGYRPPADKGPGLQPLLVGGALIVALLGGAAWWIWRRPAAPVPTQAAKTEAPAPAPAAPPTAAPLPPLNAMDPMLRTLIGALSSRPELARWLATDDLIRQMAAAIDNVSQGKAPTRDFRMFAPSGPFATTRRGGMRAIDPASYARYRSLVQLVTAVDAAAAARVYRTIQPRLNEAYRARGHADGDVNQALTTALGIVLATPSVKDPIAVTEGSGARWRFADPALESRPAAQKQLVRMGRDNAEALLDWLRAFEGNLKQ